MPGLVPLGAKLRFSETIGVMAGLVPAIHVGTIYIRRQ
jgi:hypothetical protein